jgi:hypothetical protein
VKSTGTHNSRHSPPSLPPQCWLLTAFTSLAEDETSEDEYPRSGTAVCMTIDPQHGCQETLQSKTTLPLSPERTIAYASANRLAGNRCVITGLMSRPASSKADI